MPRLAGQFTEGIARLLRPGLSLLYPPSCAFCEEELSQEADLVQLCSRCSRELGAKPWAGCAKCGATDFQDTEGACRACEKLEFDAAVVLGGYTGRIREAVLKMKRPRHEPLSTCIGDLLAERRRAELEAVCADFVVPVPMYWRRKFSRGTNSPEIVASRLARALGIGVRRQALRRSRNTLPQAELTPQQRFKNVRGAFRAAKPKVVSGARILLVDDILTSGATCSEAARALKKAGAETVAAVVIARAEGPGAG